MAENPKYPVSELTFEDKKQLDGIIIKTACEFHSLRQRFPDPKSCAKNMIVKLHSKSLIGLLHTLAYARIDPPDSIFEPGHLNRRITNDTRYTIQSADILTTNGESTHSTHNFLHPRALREEVLKKVVDLKQLVRLKGMKNINVHKHKVKTNVQRPLQMKTSKIAGVILRSM